jgi:hypothetical protein
MEINNAVFWDVTPCGFVRIDVSGERLASIIRLKETSDLVTLAVTINWSTLMMEAIRSSETSIPTRTTRGHIPEYGILHSHRRENHKSYIIKICCD